MLMRHEHPYSGFHHNTRREPDSIAHILASMAAVLGILGMVLIACPPRQARPYHFAQAVELHP